jgi:hypothetical protein
MRADRPRRDVVLLILALSAFGLWLAAIGPVRGWVRRAGIGGPWIVGVAPNAIAAFTFAHWQAFITRSGPTASVTSAVVLITLAEAAQLFLPRYTTDPWDIVAGVIGAGLAVPTLLWRARRHPC